MLQISDNASSELKKVFEADTNAEKKLIIYYVGSGCSGPTLSLSLEDEAEKYEKLESNGIDAYIDPELKTYLKQIGDIKIDYITKDDQSGYSINVGDGSCNKSGCSCG